MIKHISLLFMAVFFLLGLLMLPSNQLWAANQLKVVMLGDSLTAGFDWRLAWPSATVYNLGVGGDTTENILARLEQIREIKPDKIFLQAGINDLGYMRRNPKIENIITGHLRLWAALRQIAPDAELYVVSLLPVMEKKVTLKNKTIMDINNGLAQQAGLKNLPFIDVYSPMTDGANQLKAHYTKDGVHLLPQGYEPWVATLNVYILGKKKNASKGSDAKASKTDGKKNQNTGRYY